MNAKVSLVVMPFFDIHSPSLGPSLLKSSLENLGISTKIFYFNIKFAEKIGINFYDKLAINEFPYPALFGELIFSKQVFEQLPESDNYIKNIIDNLYSSKSEIEKNKIFNKIQNAKNISRSFIKECCDELLQEKSQIIGFSTMFHQNLSSLALVKLIKKYSTVPVIFGGANCEGEMGQTLLNNMSEVDYVCSGEGDLAVPKFISSLIQGKPTKINGILSRTSSELETHLTNPVTNMDELPYPNFDDYFTDVKKLSSRKNFKISLEMETSRGCWWGEKFQCTFCGLNGSVMLYRSKSQDRALEELKFLQKKYKINNFGTSDNILDLKYFEKFFTEIIKQKIKLKLFYETKANLSKKQLALMKRAGIHEIQPGIESLNTHILEIMKKGTTALQNIYLLKCCKELDILPHWNILMGFPDELPEDYSKMKTMIPLITHLEPPRNKTTIVLQRFSPYFMEPEKNGLVNIKPSEAYKFAYPFPHNELMKLAYNFEFDYKDGRDPYDYVNDFLNEVEYWQKLWNGRKPIFLNRAKVDGFSMIQDVRPCAVQEFHILKNEEEKIFEICETPHTFSNIMIAVKNSYPNISEITVSEILSSFVTKKLMICDDKNYLSLSVLVN